MVKRLAAFCLALSFLLVPLAADAAELARRITLQDGSVHTGYILERGDNYIVLQREDGTALELMVSAIEQIEVLGSMPTSTGASPNWAPSDDAPPARKAPPKPVEQPRVDADWADEIEDEGGKSWRTRHDEARGAMALAVAPTIPLMSAGLIQLASAPIVIGGFDPGTRFGVSIGGAVLLGSSVFTGALGAKLARDAAGVTRTAVPLRLGLAFAAGGTAAYMGSVALAHGVWAGELSNGNGNATPALAALIGSSIGAVTAGNIIFMVDAKLSRNEAYKKYNRSKNKRRSAAPVTPLAAPWFSPTDGGFAGGMALTW